MRNEIPIFQANRKKKEWERRTNMRKLWVKAWMTLDGVFDADTMDHWWSPKGEAAVDYARRIEYIAEEYPKGDVYLSTSQTETNRLVRAELALVCSCPFGNDVERFHPYHAYSGVPHD
jgi:hypothetical protein